MLRIVVNGASGILVIGSFLLVIYFQETKFHVDLYANHATVVGLMLGVAGFALTIWTLFEGLRVNKQSQEQVQHEVTRYRLEVDRLLGNVRSHTFRDACDQAYSCVEQARHNIRTNDKLRALERTEDVRKYVLRVLDFSDLIESERTPLRAIVEDLRTTITFIEAKIGETAVLNVPPGKLKPLDLFRDELDRIRSRLTKNLMEVSDAI